MIKKSTNSEVNNGDQQKPVPQECFVIMPISDQPGYAAGHFSKVYEDIFKPACASAGYTPTRADEVKQSNLIHLDILKRVVHAPMAICDLSGRNPNVLFELGLRQAFDMPTILVKDTETADIFDIAPIRYTNYHTTLSYREVLADQLAVAEALKATRDTIGQPHNVNSLIRLLELSAPAKIEGAIVADPQEYFQILMAEFGQLKREMRSNMQTRPLEVSADSGRKFTASGRAAALEKMVVEIEEKLNNGYTVESLEALINDAKFLGGSAREFYLNEKHPARFRSVVESMSKLDALTSL